MFYPKSVTENDAEPMCNANKTISYIEHIIGQK